MCGVSGIISNNLSREDLYKNIDIMKKYINHRGPDNSGSWLNNELGIGIAHNRLSILDLTRSGHQPMKSKSGRFIISFNGEIYNHIEIKNKLDKKFQSFLNWNGTSDTEVLITALDQLGLEETLKLIKGMFAFALWDNREKLLYLVRDRFGEKPLYWGFIRNNNNRSLVFASELNSIRNLPIFNNRLSEEGIKKYFHYGYISPPTSIYEEIYQIMPGNYIKISYTDFIKNNYYSPDNISWYKFSAKESDKNNFDNEKELSLNLEKLLISSLSLQNNADVPICTFLSGGIDSSLVATLLQKISTNKINTFTISFPEEGSKDSLFNEGPYASQIAKYIGTNHTDIPLTSKEALDLIPKLSTIYSEPFSDSSQIPTYLVCKAARESGYKVALTGDGADELFGGYNRHLFLPRLFSIFENKPKKLKQIITFLIKNIPLSSSGLIRDKRQKLIRSINNSDSIEDIYDSVLNLWINPNESVLISKFKNTPLELLDIPLAKTFAERIMIKDIIFYLPSDILVKSDRASMHNSLETRSPFLDYNLAEFALNIPLNLKISNQYYSRTGKYILKKILGQYIPKDLFQRPKSGFAVPIGTWIKGPLKEWANDLLNESKIKNQGFLESKKIAKIWARHLNNEYDYTPQIWSILMWQSWINSSGK
tara:strand:+ start:3470 stop:5425 length:1956 start_codon:yes stop_codon:yes gene_type:complete